MDLNEVQEPSYEAQRTTNNEGGEAFEPADTRMALYQRTVNNLIENTYYESDNEQFDALVSAAEDCLSEYPKFPLQLAAYARHELGLRDVPQVLLVISANYGTVEDGMRHDDPAYPQSRTFVREYGPRIMSRADEPLTVKAVQEKLYGMPFPRALSDAIATRLHDFDEYLFAKYDRPSREHRFRDLLNVVRPEPQDEEHAELFERIIRGDLDKFEDVEPLSQSGTWEDEKSAAGQEGDDRTDAQVWRDSLEGMGIFARIRNVRNMLQAGLDGEEILQEDEIDAVANSKMFLFRPYQAYTSITRNPRQSRYGGVSMSREGPSNVPRSRYLENWFEQAIDVAADAGPDFMGNSYTTVDLSGSMESPVSDNSSMTMKEIGALFGAISARKGAKVSGFAQDFHEFEFHPGTPILEAVKKIRGADIGMSTNAHLAIQNLINGGEYWEQVIVFTDMQVWDSTRGIYGSSTSVKDVWDQYTSMWTSEDVPQPKLYMVNLAAYGDLVMPDGYSTVYNVSGWNEQVFNFIEATAGQSPISEIADY